MKILNTIGEKTAKGAKDILNRLGEVDYLDLDQEKLSEIIGKYDIAIVGLGLNFNKEVLEKAENLKAIATATTGLDHIDVDYAKEKGVEVLSLRGEADFLNSITGTAELAFGLMIDLARLLPWAFDDVKNYKWDREKFRGHNLAGRTLGVVGIGRLGGMMARYGKVFDMEVIFYDPNVEKSEAGRKVSFEELIKESDIVSIHTHLRDETENMFDLPVFEKMKNSAYLINTSRGKIVNEDDLLKSLENKQISGYGTDVLADELDFTSNGVDEGFANHPLVEYSKKNSNLIIVPHIGGMTYESREATDVFIAKKTESYLKRI